MRLHDYAPAHLKWLLGSDPAIRWQVMRDLTGGAPNAIAAERSRVATEGWGPDFSHSNLLLVTGAGRRRTEACLLPSTLRRLEGPRLVHSRLSVELGVEGLDQSIGCER